MQGSEQFFIVILLVSLLTACGGSSGGKDSPEPPSTPQVVDTDGDGFVDGEDNCIQIANTDQLDLDKDNVGDVCDPDRDGDGALNGDDLWPDDPNESKDTDGDGVGDNADAFPNQPEYQNDTDSDGMPDKWEDQYSLNKSVNDSTLDADSEGLNNISEFNVGSDPTKADTDEDSFDDKVEVDNGLDPTSALDGPLYDTDKDGVPNGVEIADGSMPNDIADVKESLMLVSKNSDDVACDSYCGFSAATVNGSKVIFDGLPSVFGSSDIQVYLKEIDGGSLKIESSVIDDDGNTVNSDNSYGTYPDITPDGRFAAFGSSARNLLAVDTDTNHDIYFKDLMTGALEVLSLDESGNTITQDSDKPSISADGRFVVFESESRLISSDTNSNSDIYLVDRHNSDISSRVTLISRDKNSDDGGNGDSVEVKISADGNYIVFSSDATDLADCDTDTHSDIFRYHIPSETIECVSTNSGVSGDGDSVRPTITPDGRYVGFQSKADNFYDDGAGESYFAFYKDMESPAQVRLIAQNDQGTVGSDDSSQSAVISPDGKWALFYYNGSMLDPTVDTNSYRDLYVKSLEGDLSTSSLTVVSKTLAGDVGDYASINNAKFFTGKFIAFRSKSSNFSDLVDAAGTAGIYWQTYVKRLTFIPTFDTDGDGLTDNEERVLTSDLNNSDTDGDGLSDFDELNEHGTSLLKADTDDDGKTDAEEIAEGTNPFI